MLVQLPGQENDMKATALKNFLAQNPHLKFSRIIFVDDAQENIDSIHNLLRQLNIDSVLFQFSGADEMNRKASEAAAHMEFAIQPTRKQK